MKKMNIDTLIDAVQDRRALWDARDKNYNDRELSVELWNEVAKELNSTKDVVHRKWRGLRDVYRKEFKKYSKRKSNSRWLHFKHLEFLKEQMVPKGMNRTLSQKIEELIKIDALESVSSVPSKDNSTSNGDVNSTVKENTNINTDRDISESVSPVLNKENNSNNDNTGKEDTNTIVDTSKLVSILRKESTTNNGDIINTAKENMNTYIIIDTMESISSVLNNDNITISNNNINATKNNTNIKNNKGNFIKCGTKRPLESDSNLLETEENSLQSTKRNNSLKFDDDYNFLLSFLPLMKKMPLIKKLLFRLKVQELFYITMSEIETSNSNSSGKNHLPRKFANSTSLISNTSQSNHT